MLCLTRSAGQSLQIGPDIVITVVSIKAGQVRLGIHAPEDVGIVRSELLQAATTLPSRSRPANPHTAATRRPLSRQPV